MNLEHFARQQRHLFTKMKIYNQLLDAPQIATKVI